jgi:eukaryotic-like serine/threonine-protein kinase
MKQASAVAASVTLQRALIITDQTDLGRAIEHHLSIIMPGACCRMHSPKVSGRLHSAFTAAGYDVVMLDERVEGGRGLEWFENLCCRPVFPPVIFLALHEDAELASQLLRKGAVGVLTIERIDSQRLAAALRTAHVQRTARAPLEASHAVTDGLQASLPGYRCVRRLGSGGSSVVYLAESTRAGDMVVLKVLRDESATRPAPGQFSRFLQEYQLISRIRHPNVVRIFDLGVAADQAYIAMEHFPRGDLRQRLHRPLEPRLAYDYLAQITGGLQAAHEVGVLHRDLKPGNIMLRADGSLAIIDFGLAKQIGLKVDITGSGEIFGTPYYISPEQGHGRDLDERSDLYSLGVIFYEMLMGRKPYVDGNAMNVLYMHANAPLPELPAALSRHRALLAGLLAKQPEQRFANAAALLKRLQGGIEV